MKIMRDLIPDAVRPHRYFAALARERTGQEVISGPFAGMRYVNRSIGSAYVPKLLGIYERELAAVVEEIIASRPTLIVDVGAAEGYYAVGFACRLPESRMIAFETEAAGRDAVTEMAALNDVSDRVTVMGTCDADSLGAVLAGQSNAVVLMDVEGYEDVWLDPEKLSALRSATFLVELHEFSVPGITAAIAARFAETHTLELIWAEDRHRSDFPWQTAITRLLPARYINGAVSEMRPEKMCWYFGRPIARTP